eukprot:1413164-Prymnesium_polylepis.1
MLLLYPSVRMCGVTDTVEGVWGADARTDNRLNTLRENDGTALRGTTVGNTRARVFPGPRARVKIVRGTGTTGYS